MKTIIITGVIVFCICTCSLAQVGINTDGSQPNPSAILDLKSSQKGFLPPRMTTLQRNSIESPAEGLLIFNTTTGCIDYYLGGSWKSIGGVTEPVFQCGMKMKDTRDGRMYNTVKIGNQCWMAQNLNVGFMIGYLTEQTNNLILEKYCYDNNESNCFEYGGLYKWGEVVAYANGASNLSTWNPAPLGNIEGICPSGWHVPSIEEWNTVAEYAGGEPVAGGFLKESGNAHWQMPNIGATNLTGFSALPGGMWCTEDGFDNLTSSAFFWSVSETCSGGAWSCFLTSDNEIMTQYNHPKNNGFSVRCVMD